MRTADPNAPTKENLLDAAITLMLEKGFTATSVDEICVAAGATKGSFFHFFKSKEEIAKAAIARFTQRQMERFQAAPAFKLADPLQRFLGLLDVVIAAFQDPKVMKSCLLGNLTQELAPTQPRVRAVCCEAFEQINAGFAAMLAEAKSRHKPTRDFDPRAVADFFTAVIQGSLILMKAQQDSAVGVANVRQFKRYVEGLFER